MHVLRVAMWYALQESIHVEVVDEPSFAGLARSCVKILAVSVKEGGEAADERGADLVGAESGWADQADCRDAASVDGACAC